MFTKKLTENQSETNVSARPKQLMIGYYSSIKRKDLETFLYSRAEGNMSLRSSYFNIIKYEDGYIWELQEGEGTKGVLKSVIRLLDSNKDINIRIDDRFVRVTKKEGIINSISCYLLNSEDNVEETEGIEFVDSLTPVFNSGYGTFKFCFLFFLAGVFSVFCSALFKYVIYNHQKDVSFPEQVAMVPLTQEKEIEKVLYENDAYVSSIVYKNKRWVINKEKEILAPEIKSNNDSKNKDELTAILSSMDNGGNTADLQKNIKESTNGAIK